MNAELCKLPISYVADMRSKSSTPVQTVSVICYLNGMYCRAYSLKRSCCIRCISCSHHCRPTA